MSGETRKQRAYSPLWELTVSRIRGTLREPSAVFWSFAFPLITSVVLGVAFKNQPSPRLQIEVVDGPRADELAKQLDAVPGLAAERAPLEEAKLRIRRGRAALVVVPGEPPELMLDPTQGDGRTARLMVSDALQRLHGRQDVLTVRESQLTTPGTRYIDFLIPGLLGMALMSAALWGMSYNLVNMRVGKLMKRLVATPMRRVDFLLAFAANRFIFAMVDVVFFASFSRLLFGVHITGGLVNFVVFAMAGAACFLAIGLLVASRAVTSEAANGWINVVSMPMMFFSGIFFSPDRFPAWSQPLIRALPLTAINEGLRAITNQGASLAQVGPQLLVIAAWGLVSFVLALKLFRWN